MKNVIFLSPPCAGKGTFSEYLVKNYSYTHLSTGDLLREKAKSDTKLKEFLKSGALVSDETILEILKEKLSSLDKSKPFILDGVPRTLQQAKVLDIILSGFSYVVIAIDVKKDILENRVLGRKICSSCGSSYNDNITEYKPKTPNVCDICGSPLIKRVDDNINSYRVRYQTFLDNTLPLYTYYENLGRLKRISNNDINSSKSLEEMVGVLSD